MYHVEEVLQHSSVSMLVAAHSSGVHAKCRLHLHDMHYYDSADSTLSSRSKVSVTGCSFCQTNICKMERIRESRTAVECIRLGCRLQQAGTHLDCRLELHTVCLAQVDGNSEDWHHLGLVVTIQSPGQLLQATLDSVPQGILHLLVNLFNSTLLLTMYATGEVYLSAPAAISYLLFTRHGIAVDQKITKHAC